VIVALLAPPEFGSTVNSASPLPFPLVRSLRIHAADEDAVQLHPAVAVTCTVRGPPCDGICAEDRLRLNRQGAACWVMVTRVSLTTTAPERGAATVFSAAVSVSDASPWPLRGVTCSHATSVAASHAHSRVVLTVTLTRTPDAASDPGTPFTVVPHLTGVGPVDCDTSVPPQPAVRTATRRTLSVQGRQDGNHIGSLP
jgi:hypothetical protein